MTVDVEKVNSSGSVMTLSSDPEDIGTGRTRSYFVPEFANYMEANTNGISTNQNNGVVINQPSNSLLEL